MMTDPPTHDPASPLSWRDVYKAVGDSETRIIAAVKETIGQVSLTQADHELRIRAIESIGSIHAQSLQREMTALEIRLTAAEKFAEATVNREKGIFATFSVAQKFFLTFTACVGVIWVIIEIVSRLSV